MTEPPPPTTQAARDRLEGTYISVLVSATSESHAEQRRESLEDRFGRRFGILLSDDYESLNPGYWVVYAGPFETRQEANRACGDMGLGPGGACYARVLSQDRSDR